MYLDAPFCFCVLDHFQLPHVWCRIRIGFVTVSEDILANTGWVYSVAYYSHVRTKPCYLKLCLITKTATSPVIITAFWLLEGCDKIRDSVYRGNFWWCHGSCVIFATFHCLFPDMVMLIFAARCYKRDLCRRAVSHLSVRLAVCNVCVLRQNKHISLIFFTVV